MPTNDNLTIEEIIDRMKNKLQEYWVNELCLPLEVQLKSMAIMDLVLHELKEDKNKIAFEVIDSLKQLRDHLRKGETNDGS